MSRCNNSYKPNNKGRKNNNSRKSGQPITTNSKRYKKQEIKNGRKMMIE